MEQGKPTNGTGRDAPVVDPVLIRETLAELQKTGAEFPIRVEGTHTLPYTAHLHRLDLQASQIFLKLIRPLPHEMLPGAPFEMSFAAGEQRFTAPMTFQGREAYLLYRFTIPQRMLQNDRRRHKRYPFRPREKAYVLAQDARLPGHGLSGPLVNLSLGGLSFRVDRILRLDDHLCIPASVGFFERGRELPVVKVRDLPRLPLFDTRGIITYAWERGNEVILGIKFAELSEAETTQLQTVIDFRELVQRNPNQAPTRPETAQETLVEGPPQGKSTPARRVNPAGTRTPDALVRLGRRCTTILLALPPGSARDEVQDRLRTLGYQRIEVEDSLAQAQAGLERFQDASSPILICEYPLDAEDARSFISAYQLQLGEGRDLPVAILQPQETLLTGEDPLIRSLPWPQPDPAKWLPILDDLAGL